MFKRIDLSHLVDTIMEKLHIEQILDAYQDFVVIYTAISEDGLVVIGRKSQTLQRLIWSAAALGIVVFTFPIWLIGKIWGRLGDSYTYYGPGAADDRKIRNDLEGRKIGDE